MSKDTGYGYQSQGTTNLANWHHIVDCLGKLDVIMHNGKVYFDAKPDLFEFDRDVPLQSIAFIADDNRIEVPYIGIKCVIPQPINGLDQQKLGQVELSDADNLIDQSGKTYRQAIIELYQPKTDQELDYLLRRALAGRQTLLN